MLSSFMPSGASFRTSATAPAASSAPADAAVAETVDASGAGQQSVGELFAGQLNDAIVGDALMDAEPLAEAPVTESTSESVIANAQTPAEPSAEEWLLAMLDQQLLQLQARDTQIAAAPVAAQTAVDVEQVNAAAAIATDTLEKIAIGKNPASLATENNLNKIQIHSAAEKNMQLDKTLEANVKTAANVVIASAVVNTQPNADSRNANNSVLDNNALLNTASAAAINAALASGSPAAGATELTHNSNVISPAVVNTAGETNSARAVKTQSAMPAPEAKWGEQLLHTLRDQVQVQIQQKIQNATIRLDPPELGSLEIYLSHESGRLTVNITASQADVARLIQTTSDRLRQELAGPQFTHVNVQTSAEGQSGQQQSRERQRFFEDQQILGNDQSMVGNSQPTNRSGDVLVTV
ncbi:MAG TPA: flagellar hook-length control protein FliK [Cellvibrio sp.]|nr:flagellar hook-length control protein FliK [Cellvibrio sp.]